MQDPPRIGVKEAIAKCKRAGINVIMITGDVKETARAIAHDIGIIDKSQTDRCFTGLDFFNLSES